MSIKEGIEHLPTGLCFCDEDGLVLLTNRRMSDLCHAITGGALLDAGAFWGRFQAAVSEAARRRFNARRRRW